MAVEKSIRQRIVEAFKARLEAIHGPDFQTNAGQRVYLGVDAEFDEENDLTDPSDTAAIEMRIGEIPKPDHQMERIQFLMPIIVTLITVASYRQPWIAIEAARGDVTRAVMTDDRTLGGLVPSDIEIGEQREMPRERGSEVVGWEMTFEVLFSEAWGHPESM